MSTPQGTAWETEVARYLQAQGFDQARRSEGREGPKDHGDIAGFRRWALDCKDRAKMSLGSWVRQAEGEARHSGKPLSAAIVKRRGGETSEALVVMSLSTWVQLEKYLDALSDTITERETQWPFED